jgi:alkaline phosphatase
MMNTNDRTLCLVAALLGSLVLANAQPISPPKVKNVILFIGDGMQLEHEIAASQYLFGKEKKLSFHHLGYSTPMTTWDVTTYNRFARALGEPPYDPASFNPELGYCPELGGKRPYPDDRTGLDAYFLTKLEGKLPATDSASAATAWATGYKTDDGNIAWLAGDPADGALKTIAELAREQRGAAIGVVSTVPFNHATPAAHVSHNKSRGNYHAISEEIVRVVKPEVVIGGGHPAWSPDFMSSAAYAEIKADSEYVFVERQVGIDAAPALRDAAATAVNRGKKLFGLFGGTGGNFEPPIPSDTPGAPSIARGNIENPLLSHATTAALEVLSQDPDGFFVMLEQGDIDWANHNNNYAWMVGTTWDLHESVIAAIEFVERPGDQVTWENTLLIVTSDHGNSYLRLGRKNNQPLAAAGDLPGSGEIGGITISGGKALFSPAGALAYYGTGDHTDELTMLYAHGKGIDTLAKRQGQWYPGTRILDNTQLFEAMAEALGIVAPTR